MCYLHLRFRTSADLDGVERLAVMPPDSSFLTSEYKELPHLEGRSHVLSYYRVDCMVNTCCLPVKCCAWDVLHFPDSLPTSTLVCPAGLREQLHYRSFWPQMLVL